ncbi:MAG TPA: amidohydrolase family protein, partial [Tepidisphaeraceae bacterium]|nr:amidohydrolase family protein [Tepidisphaeraceae bacterium]
MPDLSQIVHGPALLPQADGTVAFHCEVAIKCNAHGRIDFVGDLSKLIRMPGTGRLPLRSVRGVIVPPFVDCHTHVPQHPIRGRFLEGVAAGSLLAGLLLAGLLRNVYPAEARFADAAYARDVTAAFHADTLKHGVVGGAAYVTSHAPATRSVLDALPDTWSAGLVLMDQHCPPELHITVGEAERVYRELAASFGRRVIVTDRFAPVVTSRLRTAAAAWAAELDLRMQTHLNEQRAEKRLVEAELYPDARSYAGVYDRDGLLGRRPILAHCVHQTPAEWDLLAARAGCVVAHCPTSNALLGSGVMPLDEIVRRRIPWVLCTDVGASPTVSLLAEMTTFL